MVESFQSSLNEVDARLFAAQTAWLARLAPGHRIARIRWAGGATQLIELGPMLDEQDPPPF